MYIVTTFVARPTLVELYIPSSCYSVHNSTFHLEGKKFVKLTYKRCTKQTPGLTLLVFLFSAM